MPGRKYQAGSSSYRYSINGQEKSDEIAPNTMTAEFWEYDSKIVRRWNRDPRPNVSFSPYSAFECNPIWFADPLGDTVINGNHYEKKGGELLPEVQIIGKRKMTLEKLNNKFPGMMNLAKQAMIGTATSLYTGNYNTYSQVLPSKLDNLSEAQKQRDFKESAAKTTAILLWEFMNGTGADTRYFNEFQHPIANEIKWSIQANMALNMFAEDIKNGKIKDGQEYYYYGGSSPDKIPFLASVKAHANEYLTTPSAFYRGGMRFYFIKTPKIIIARAEDAFNVSSMLPNSRDERDNIYREGHVKPFGETKVIFQFYYRTKDGSDFPK